MLRNPTMPLLAESDVFAPAAPGTMLLGLIGSGIAGSRSPAMHVAEAAAQGFALEYRRIDLDVLGLGVEALPQLLDHAQAACYRGLNITYPAKLAVIPLLDALSDEARALGAVNTVVFEAGRRIGHNTDASGFAAGFRLQLPGVAMAQVVQIGAGGAGAAVAHAVLAMGAGQLAIFDMDPARAAALSANLNAHFGPGRAVAGGTLSLALAAADGLVHATPMGMAKHPGLPLPAALLRADLWVAEVVYVPIDTALLQAARALGAPVADGGGMAVYQAADAFRHFTGREPDTARMRQGFLAAISHPG
jgi:shikimate dehydrogenase